MKKNFYSTEEILEMLENMNDDSENEEQAKEEFDILMDEVFAFVMDMAKEKLASPGDEIHLPIGYRSSKTKSNFLCLKL